MRVQVSCGRRYQCECSSHFATRQFKPPHHVSFFPSFMVLSASFIPECEFQREASRASCRFRHLSRRTACWRRIQHSEKRCGGCGCCRCDDDGCGCVGGGGCGDGDGDDNDADDADAAAPAPSAPASPAPSSATPTPPPITLPLSGITSTFTSVPRIEVGDVLVSFGDHLFSPHDSLAAAARCFDSPSAAPAQMLTVHRRTGTGGRARLVVRVQRAEAVHGAQGRHGHAAEDGTHDGFAPEAAADVGIVLRR